MPAPGSAGLSDGFSEAANMTMEEFGDERLKDLAVAHRGEGAAELIERITAEVKAFCGEASQFDDMTIVVVRRVA
jgi:serine phosphatase RsbU (regulator of sigma subunit)